MGRRFLIYIKYTCFAKNNESLERKTGKKETAICADTKEDGSRLIVYNIRFYLGNIFIFLKNVGAKESVADYSIDALIRYRNQLNMKKASDSRE